MIYIGTYNSPFITKYKDKVSERLNTVFDSEERATIKSVFNSCFPPDIPPITELADMAVLNYSIIVKIIENMDSNITVRQNFDNETKEISSQPEISTTTNDSREQVVCLNRANDERMVDGESEIILEEESPINTKKKRKLIFEKFYKLYDYIRDCDIEADCEIEQTTIDTEQITPIELENDMRRLDIENNENMTLKKTNIRMAKELGLTVCPYCNRNYINNRNARYSGSQLDHFYNRSDYLLFAVSLYNLVPSCSSCNHVKAKKKCSISPFDPKLDSNKLIKFSIGGDRVTDPGVAIEYHASIDENMTSIEIETAYAIHHEDLATIVTKHQIYSKSQQLEIFQLEKRANAHIYEPIDFDSLVFGEVVTSKEFKRKSLAKMKQDVLIELGVRKEEEVYLDKTND